jgi:bifunctional UDP-N-acetylglucosamine pyrophosphorylase/glucosamine-1-phosphate N-acetyltransferase
MKKSSKDVAAIILAAGEGTRMNSKIPKVLHTLADRPLVAWVLDAARKAGSNRVVAVLGHQAERVAKALPPEVLTAIQSQQLGTGHAVKSAQKTLAGVRGEVFVLCGDAPLIRPETLRRLLKEHRRLKAKATVLTARVDHPHGYGRILRDAPDSPWIARIVEERDASAEERAITEVNSGAYCFDLALLWEMLDLLRNNNRKGEYYLTDVVELMRKRRHPVAAVSAGEDGSEIFGINSRADLAKAGRALNDRVLSALMDQGVTILDPASTWVEPGVKVGQDTVLFPGVRLTGHTVIGEECKIGPQTWVDASRIGRECKVRYSILESVRLADRVRVGPYSHLRPGAVIEADVYIGNYAEINRSRVQQGVKVGHVSYLGDAVIGKRVNIGAGSITANYDGVKKNPTRIGDDAFIGSGTVMVAPCQIGRGSLTGAGAVLKRGTVIPPQTVAVGVPARVIKKREK